VLAGVKPAIVVIAYNRPRALQRLLDSLARATYPGDGDVSLVISIDRGADGIASEVARLAHDFAWQAGPKEVIERPERLGLVPHFRECGRLAQRLEGVVLLEDDLVVAPPFYEFATQALECYQDEPRIAGVCLYGLWFNGFTHEPFLPVEDGNDVFFLKLPYTQGLAFTAEQWRAFDEAYPKPAPHPDLPAEFLRFGPDEWFPSLAYYLAQTGRYFCFPRISLTVGWGDEGTHFAGSTSWLQTPLQLGSRRYALPAFDEAVAVYDAFYELLPERLRALSRALPEAGFDVDLNATKQPANLEHELVLTTRPARQTLASFGLRMQPPELNLVHAVPGDEIVLARREDVYWDAWAGREARRRLHAYAWSRHRPSRHRAAVFTAAKLVQQARRWWGRHSR
jgi:hypothetical protein